jgi:hypothetical protein
MKRFEKTDEKVFALMLLEIRTITIKVERECTCLLIESTFCVEHLTWLIRRCTFWQPPSYIRMKGQFKDITKRFTIILTKERNLCPYVLGFLDKIKDFCYR